jgi:Protein of unknown function (DUF1631)
MSPREPKVSAALDAAVDLIRATTGTLVSDAPTMLLEKMRASHTYHERSQLAAAQSHILVCHERLNTAFGIALREKVDADLAGTGSPELADLNRPKTDWSAISLVEEDKIQEDISFGRIGQFISHECDAELRELSSYMSALLHHGRADPERNPVRGSVIGWAMHSAIEKVTPDIAVERTLVKELGMAFAVALKSCYGAILADLVARGVRPAELVARQATEAPRQQPAGGQVLSEEAVKNWERSLYGRLVVDAGDDARRWEASIAGRAAQQSPQTPSFQTQEAAPPNSVALLERLMRGEVPAAMSPTSPFFNTPGLEHSDANLTNLVRRLNQTIDSVRGSLEAGAYDSAFGAAGNGSAPNLIRANREALEQASQGKLDHMVIEVVSSLFDQIFSDLQVPPQMARQIARLQLPVLRVAMRDPGFFASRRHPVRRFINRVSSLGVAMDGFDSGPGKELLERVQELIQQIVDGDFEQVEVYAEKLLELERFTADQARAEIKAGAAGVTLQAKELEWRQLNRFTESLRSALEPLPLEPYLKEFLAQAWGQVIVTASLRDGADSPAARKYRVGGYELTLSVQPKRSLDDRKRFVASLPGLMATLNEGMTLIGWPASKRDDFFGKLISGHAGSLKTAPASDLDHNLLMKRLQAIFKTPMPGLEEAASAGVPQTRVLDFEQQFSAEEAQSVGLVAETSVNWARPVEPVEPVEPESADAVVSTVAAAFEDENGLPVISAEALEPTPSPVPVSVTSADDEESAGTAHLRDQLQVGFSYRLQLEDQWEKVRLTYMSPGRNFFMFTHGSKDRRSISMTARMLDRLCQTGRMCAIEASYLIDRATERARQQLAQLSSSVTPDAARAA